MAVHLPRHREISTFFSSDGLRKSAFDMGTSAIKPLELVNRSSSQGVGIIIDASTQGNVKLNGSTYSTGVGNKIMKVDAAGVIELSNNATIDSNGNGTFKNLDLLNVTDGGTFRGNKLQSNDATKTLELFNRSTVGGVGVLIDNTTAGNVTLTGSSYSGVVNRIMKVNGAGQIELSNVTIDNTGNFTASNTTLDSLTLKNNLNFDLDNPCTFMETFCLTALEAATKY